MNEPRKTEDDDDLKIPSKWSTEKVVQVENQTEQNVQDEKNLGKWISQVKIDDIDRIWEVIREWTENGEFWKYSELYNEIKIDSRNNKWIHSFNIEVYTYDRKDEVDVSRIREKLLQIDGVIENNLDYRAEISYEEQIKFKPTTCTEQHWIYARNKSDRVMKDSLKTGKWLIFRKFDQIEKVWEEIKNAVEQGQLWRSAKVSTIKDFEERNEGVDKTFVICVYTYDWRDDTDVYRIRRQLRVLGIYEKIKYKSDEDTLNGIYKVNLQRGQKIAKYFA